MKPKSRRPRASAPPPASGEPLQGENAGLRARLAEAQARLAEAEETLEAIRSGAVDALVISGPEGEQVFSLQGAETTYRFLVEDMNEGAMLLGLDGTVLYANARCGQLLNTPIEQIVGARWERLFPPAEHPRLGQLLRAAAAGSVRTETYLQRGDASSGSSAPLPVAISLRSLERENLRGFALVITDLTAQKAAESALREANERLELRVQQRTAQLTRSNDSLLAEMDQRKRSEEELRLQREWFRVTLTSIGDAVIACDSQLRVTFMNPVAAHLSGWGADEACGQPVTRVFNIVNEFSGQPADNLMARVLQEQRVLGLATPANLVTRDGRHIPVEDSAAPIFNSAGETIGVIIVFHDVTAKRHTQEILRQSEQRLAMALEGGQMGMWQWDLQTGHSVWNAKEYELLGLPVGNGHPSAELFIRQVHSEDREAFDRSLQEAFGQREDWRHEFRIVRPDGQVRWLAGAGRATFNEQGRAERMVGVNYDITERRAFQAELERLVTERTSRLQELVTELEHFSYTITHDMRAPLRAMQAFAEMFVEACANCQQQDAHRFLQRIRTSARRMDALIRDALSYSEAIRKHLPLAPLDLGLLLRGMLDTYPELQGQQASIQLQPGIPLVFANEAGLTQVFSNLLNNAIKFAKPGQPAEICIRAELTTRPSEPPPNPQAALTPTHSTGFTPIPSLSAPASGSPTHWVRIWVEDQGIGIASEMLPRVFNMFARGSNEQSGTGVGLALVRKVVDRMGGRVGVESQEGQGSRFWLELIPADQPLVQVSDH